MVYKEKNAGLVRRDSIEELKDRIDMEAVVSPIVTLSKPSGNSMKGLCPFHTENTASFHIRTDLKRYHCFGCGESGDVFAFVQKTQNVSFGEALMILAEQFNVELKYEDDTTSDIAQKTYSTRMRLLEAHKIAAAYYRHNLDSPEAATAQQYLIDRNFTPEHAQMFGCGYAPKGWHNLYNVLHERGFTDQELFDSGLVINGKRGPVDIFRGRLVWPIKDVNGAVVGFGARRIYDDDDGAKYLNSPETLIYKKNKILFGLDLARKSIATQKRAVVVEGYTDVMACHAAGATTAVAACGTAFGEEHAKILSRLLSDTSIFSGEIIYTFDGDSAGQKAAMKALQVDHLFRTRTFVAIADEGKDPCEVRLAYGDEGVSQLFASRIPLFEFAIKDVLKKHDLLTPEGRVNAMNAAAPLIVGIKDKSLQIEYIRLVAGWVSKPIDDVQYAVKRAEHQASQDHHLEQPSYHPEDSHYDDETPHSDDGDNDRETPIHYTITGKESGYALQHVLIQRVSRLDDRSACQYLSYVSPDNFSVPALKELWNIIYVSNPQKPISAVLSDLQDDNPSLSKILTEIIVSDVNEDKPSDEYLKCCVYDLLVFDEENKVRNIEAALGSPDLSEEEADSLMKAWAKHTDNLSALNEERLSIDIPIS